MLVDYLHPRKFPFFGPLMKWTLRTATLGVLVGVYQFNTNDIGMYRQCFCITLLNYYVVRGRPNGADCKGVAGIIGWFLYYKVFLLYIRRVLCPVPSSSYLVACYHSVPVSCQQDSSSNLLDIISLSR